MEHEIKEMNDFRGGNVSNEEERGMSGVSANFDDGKNCLAVIADAYSSSEDETSADTRLNNESSVVEDGSCKETDTNNFVNVGVNPVFVLEKGTPLEEQNNNLNGVNSTDTASQINITTRPKGDACILPECDSDGCALIKKESDDQLSMKAISNTHQLITPNCDGGMPLDPKSDGHTCTKPDSHGPTLIKPKDNECALSESNSDGCTSVKQHDDGRSCTESDSVAPMEMDSEGHPFVETLTKTKNDGDIFQETNIDRQTLVQSENEGCALVAAESGGQTLAELDNTVDTPPEPKRDECILVELEQNSHTPRSSDVDTCPQVYTMSSIDKELVSISETGGVSQTEGLTEQTTGDNSSSSDSSSDDESSSSESESSETSSDDNLDNIRKEIEREEEQVHIGPLKTKSELSMQQLPEVPDVDITVDENVQLVELGLVFSILQSLVVVKALPQRPALDSESVLFLENRACLGLVFETFGPVQTPFYSVRFNNEADINKRNVHVGDRVFYAPDMMEYSNFVFVAQLKKLRGSDASWEHDEEPPKEAIEYSDDEEEAKARASKKKERMAKKGSGADVDKASSTESERNFHQGPNRGGRKRTWQNRGRGRPGNQNPNQGNSATSSFPSPHPAYRGPAPPARGTLPPRAPPHVAQRPSFPPGNPYMSHPPQEAPHLVMGHVGPPRGLPPRVPFPMGPSPGTHPGLMGNVPMPQYAVSRPFTAQHMPGQWPVCPPSGFVPRYPVPGPQGFHDHGGNVGLQPNDVHFGVWPPPPPPPPPNS